MSGPYSRSQKLSQNQTSRDKKFILQHFCNFCCIFAACLIWNVAIWKLYTVIYRGNLYVGMSIGHVITHQKHEHQSIGWIEGNLLELFWNCVGKRHLKTDHTLSSDGACLFQRFQFIDNMWKLNLRSFSDQVHVESGSRSRSHWWLKIIIWNIFNIHLK